MKFSDYAGDTSIDTSHLKTFVDAWYNPDDIVVIVAISVNSPRRKVLSQTIPAHELAVSTPDEIEDLCSSGEDKFNTYMSIFPVKDENNVSLKSRGSKEDVKEVYGVFTDFDVKEGAFESKAEIITFVNSLPHRPTIIVDNGETGGVHVYWRLNRGETDNEELLFMWWCYISSMTDKKIDRLIDSTRISRLPSGIYWGKEGQKSDTVKVITANGPTYSSADLRSISNDAFEGRKKKIETIIRKDQISKRDVGELAAQIYSEHNGTGFTWSAKLALSKLEEMVNTELTWNEILEPHGWEHRRTLRDDTNEWARPGQSARSAVTDYRHDDGSLSPVMSLLSQSEDTGLQDLLDAQIPLTKYRVHLRLKYNDNERQMLIDMKERLLG